MLRRQPTNAEQRLWSRLRAKQLGVTFRRQYSVDAYVLDFYAPRAKLAIEVDGSSHLEPRGIQHDEKRTTHLNAFGIEVVRFTNLDVLQNLDGVIEVISESVRRRTTSP
jgi:very-short-patch-repair endonuclease